MAEIGRWNKYIFEVTPGSVSGFSDLTIKGAGETEDKTGTPKSKKKDKKAKKNKKKVKPIKYVKFKNSKPLEITMSVKLYASMGIDVHAWALSLVADANNGENGFLYLGEEKLVPFLLMLTEAKVEKVKIRLGGVWTEAQVKLTFKNMEYNVQFTSADYYDPELSDLPGYQSGTGTGKFPPKGKMSDETKELYTRYKELKRLGAGEYELNKLEKEIMESHAAYQAILEEQKQAKAAQRAARRNTTSSGSTGLSAAFAAAREKTTIRRT